MLCHCTDSVETWADTSSGAIARRDHGVALCSILPQQLQEQKQNFVLQPAQRHKRKRANAKGRHLPQGDAPLVARKGERAGFLLAFPYRKR